MTSPSISRPGDSFSLSTVLRFVQRQIKMDLDGCLPARVTSFDRKTNRVSVRPTVMLTKKSATGGAKDIVPRQLYPDVPVISLGAGGFHISFPIKPGDLGWLFAGDRDDSLFLQNLEQSVSVQEGASHNFGNGVFIPDVFRRYTISAEDTENLVIQSTDGRTRISVSADKVKVTTPVSVQLETPLVNASRDVIIGGNLTVNGSRATLPSTTTVGGSNVTGHNHAGRVPGFPA